jgi:hypothetical protein
MASILKTFAIAAGAGVAFGICTTAVGTNRPARRREHADVVDIEPLLDRLENLERRFESSKPAVPVTELASRIDAQEAEIERLRVLVDARATEIEQRLGAEIEERNKAALDSIEKTVELKVSERIAAIERTLMEQSASIESLRDRAIDTDANLKRLIGAIERLCERTQPIAAPAPPPVPQPVPGPTVVPFESHLAEARAKQEEKPAPADFRSAIFKEEEKKSRFPLARIFGMVALVVITQFLTH